MLAYSSRPPSTALGPPTPSFLPPNPSPLSPRRDRTTTATNTTNTTTPPRRAPRTNTPFAQRPIRAPRVPRHAELAAQRRATFLQRGREGREQRRFEARADDVRFPLRWTEGMALLTRLQAMRMEFVRGRRAWEAELVRGAPAGIEEEEDGEVEEVLRWEEREVEALVGLLGGEMAREQGVEARLQGQWSDDEDYDALFAGLLEGEAGGGAARRGGDEMDLS